MKFTLTATIPTGQYANVQPTIEVEADTWKEARSIADKRLRQIWNDYCEDGKELRPLPEGAQVASVLLESEVTGGKAYFNEVSHTYTTEDGKALLSGSAFADMFKPPFNKPVILKAMEKKHDIPVSEIERIWQLKADASTEFGNSIHHAIELHGKFKEHCIKMDKPSVHENPYLAKAVTQFFEGRDKEVAKYEVFVMNEKLKLCGFVDRLLITGDKSCRVQDFKTNGGPIDKIGKPAILKEPFNEVPNSPLGGYTLQLNFYADLLELAGWNIEGLDIFHWRNDSWKPYQVERMHVVNKLPKGK